MSSQSKKMKTSNVAKRTILGNSLASSDHFLGFKVEMIGCEVTLGITLRVTTNLNSTTTNVGINDFFICHDNKI
jgi:hypothetical protein